MKMRKNAARLLSALLALLLCIAFLPGAAAAGEENLDYANPANWAYFETDRDRDVDVFLVCPLVDTRSERNSYDLNDKLKSRFLSALDMERGIYEDVGRLFSPYYRQMSLNAFKLPEKEQAEAAAVAYGDVSTAFRWYLDNVYDGRGLILAGFSQGSMMCLELMKEYFGEGGEAEALRDKLIAVYAIGWSITEEMTERWPQLVPAKGETDTGVIVSFDCEDGSLTETMVNPAGKKALSINPLNWRTDGEEADASLNLGAVMSTGAEPIPALCGARIGERGELVVTGLTAGDYPPGIDLFPEGSFHVYDYLFFFTNLKENVAARTAAWRTGLPFKDVEAGKWYTGAVTAAWQGGLMNGTEPALFRPGDPMERAQLVTVLWRLAGAPVVNHILPFGDVKENAWYSEAVRWAEAEGLIPWSGSFGPGEALRRDEAALLVWRYAASVGADQRTGETPDLSGYIDISEATESSLPALKWAVGTGLMKGTGEGRLDPAGTLSRAQAAALLLRLAELTAAPLPLSLQTEDSAAAAAPID